MNGPTRIVNTTAVAFLDRFLNDRKDALARVRTVLLDEAQRVTSSPWRGARADRCLRRQGGRTASQNRVSWPYPAGVSWLSVTLVPQSFPVRRRGRRHPYR